MGSASSSEQRNDSGTCLSRMESVDAHRQVNIRACSLSQPCPGVGDAAMQFLDLRSTHRDPERSTMDSAVLKDQSPSVLSNDSGGEQGVEPDVVEYLKDPPDAATLKGILKKLGTGAADLLRRKEAPFRELGLADKLDDEAALIAAMVDHPVLIERPIVVAGRKARIGRPPEDVLEIL